MTAPGEHTTAEYRIIAAFRGSPAPPAGAGSACLVDVLVVRIQRFAAWEAMVSHKHHSAQQLFEELATATWDRIRYGVELECSQGEETITDINLLDMKRAALPNLYLWKANKAAEAETGLDWEWWVGSNGRGWWRYAVQAKKLSKTGSYDSLRHKVRGRQQFDLLTEYAKANRGCIPLYCFYNYVPSIVYPRDCMRYWHCRMSFAMQQLGCTVAPIDVVRMAYPKYSKKTFHAISSCRSVLPWRCLVTCPALLPQGSRSRNALARDEFIEAAPFEALPSILAAGSEQNYQQIIASGLYSQDVPIRPKRIMVVDVGQ